MSTGEINSDDYFYKLNEDFEFVEEIKQFIPTSMWIWVPFMMVSANLPFDMINRDTFLKSIPREFKPRLNMYKIPKHSVYNWHKDSNVKCAFNMVLDEYDCHTIFWTSNSFEGSREVSNIIELKYEPCKWYMFNNQQTHQVVNVGDRDRALFTVIFPDTTYPELRAWYKEYESTKTQ